MINHCGTCTACCQVFAISELEKPAGKWCNHCAVGKGCRAYEVRPKTCVEFECIWLQSQSEPDAKLPLELRPDNCKVVFSGTTNQQVVSATTMANAPEAWTKRVVRKLIETITANGGAVVVGGPTDTTRLLLDKSGAREVKMTPPDENGIQWNITKC